jgi:hypothetical protein
MLQANSSVFVVLAVEAEVSAFCVGTFVDREFRRVLEVWYRGEFVVDFGGIGGDGCEAAGRGDSGG